MKMHLGAPVKHLLVDLDGTLLGNRAFPLSFDFANRALGVMKKYGGIKKATSVLLDIYREMGTPSKQAVTNDNRVVELFSRRMNLSLEEARHVLRESVIFIFPSLEKHFYPIPDSKDFLDWAKDRYPLTLATNPVWPPEVIEMRVKWAGIDPAIFGFVTHVRLMSSVKPHPEYYQEILKHQGLRAEDCLLIGNSEKMDLPATRIGIRVFIVTNPKTKKEREKTIASLKFKNAQAPAWKGTYPELRHLLESQTPPQL
jgi:FMN phosphatase YigB (HAD superfamily)